MTKQIEVIQGAWRGHLLLWDDPVPEVPGAQFRLTDRTVFNIPYLTGADMKDVGIIMIVRKDDDGLFIAVRTDKTTVGDWTYEVDASKIKTDYILDPKSGEKRLRLLTYPIIKVGMEESVVNNASPHAVVTQSSPKRPRRARSAPVQKGDSGPSTEG